MGAACFFLSAAGFATAFFNGFFVSFLALGVMAFLVDLVVLDLPTPWNAIQAVEKALRVGGYLVVYNPQITQTADFVNAVKANDKFIHEKTIELIERNWKINGPVARPRSGGIGHTGFLSFVRRV